MPHTALTPVFVGLRTALHLLVAALTGLVIARALIAPGPASGAIVAVGALLAVTYAAGGLIARRPRRGRLLPGRVWLAVISIEWAVLLALTPDAAYLVFPLFFLLLHLLGPRAGIIGVLITTGIAVVALAAHDGFTVAGVIGPAIGAGVAVTIGLGYRALAAEAAEREQLVAELLATRDRLALTEHRSGVLAERARLAREIHDTVAQGLASIQMLLHAAERADPAGPGVQHVRLARDTAAAGLADTRRFIRELTPPDLDDHGLGGALRRLAGSQWAAGGVTVEVRVADLLPLPMHVQTALLRIAQGAIANVIQHAEATTATIDLAADQETIRFTITDDGRGFDPATTRDRALTSGSFGLQATRQRVAQLGGSLTIHSAPGAGTTLAVELPVKEPA